MDEGFEGLVSGTGIAETNKKQLIITARDRMRVPWLGGARLLNPSVALPIVLLPSFLLMATLNLELTLLSFSLLVLCLLGLYKYWLESMPRIFLMWSISSLVILYVVYEVIVVSFLMILLEENIGLSVVMFAAIYLAYRTKLIVIRMKEPIFSTRGSSAERSGFCNVCQIYRPDGTQHHYWIDSCIIPNCNKIHYIGCLICTFVALIYSSMLTLTSVCHPFKFVFVLLPDDCSDVYQQIEMSLSFVTAIYSLLLAAFILWQLICTLFQCRRQFRLPNKMLRVIFNKHTLFQQQQQQHYEQTNRT